MVLGSLSGTIAYGVVPYRLPNVCDLSGGALAQSRCDIEGRCAVGVDSVGEQYQHHLPPVTRNFRHQGATSVWKSARTDQGTRAHLLDAERGRELTQVKPPSRPSQGRHIAAQISARRWCGGSRRRRSPAAAFQAERVGELHDDVPGAAYVRAGAPLHIHETQPQTIADGEAELPRLRPEQEQTGGRRASPGAHRGQVDRAPYRQIARVHGPSCPMASTTWDRPRRDAARESEAHAIERVAMGPSSALDDGALELTGAAAPSVQIGEGPRLHQRRCREHAGGGIATRSQIGRRVFGACERHEPGAAAWQHWRPERRRSRGTSTSPVQRGEAVAEAAVIRP